MNLFRLSLNLLRRDLRAGEWRVLLISLVLAVASVATVGLFADRVRLTLQREATSLIGADLRISSTRPLPQAYREAAQQRGLRVIGSDAFPSMVAGKNENLLADIMSVEQGYPLRGKIIIDDGAQHVIRNQNSSIPARGTLWADERLMQRLGLQLGDEVGIGMLHLRVAARVVRFVDQSVGFASFAPRVIVNARDLPGSGLIQEGSRIGYRLMVAGDAKQVADLRMWLQNRLTVGQKLEDVGDARPEIRSALDRAEHFLGLAALTAVVLAGVALALASRHFISRHLDSCAMMRCLGAGQSQVLRIFLYQFLLLGACAVLLGELLGYIAQAALVESIASMREAGLPPPGWTPMWQAAASGIALLLGFAFLPLWQLKSVSPLRVIRRELGAPEAGAWLLYVSGGAVLCGLFLWQAGSLKLGLTVLGGLLAGLLLFGMLAWLMVRALGRFGSHVFSNLARHARSNAVLIVALSLGGMALLLLTFVRADLMDSWRSRLPPDAPNRFIVNIQPGQRAAVLEFFARHKLSPPELFPMVRGRLVEINHQPVSGDDYPDPRARALAERETNLSWLDHLPEGNELVQGNWFARGDKSVLSVEEGIAKTLGIHMGDTLTYDVAGSRFSAQVVNLRKVEWDSMQVNFFVVAAPGMLEGFPASYITSFHLPTEHAQAANALIRRFPNLLLIDVEAMIEQVRHIMDQISQTMSAVFTFTLLSGVAVLYAALLATQDERVHEAAILRTLGADSRYLRRLHLGEFAVLGVLSGLFAAAGAVLLGWTLARFVLDIPYRTGIAIWLSGGLGGMAVVMLAGWLGTRRLTKLPALAILRE
ncbi:MAG: ABC transporter permease [Candidatus Gallionella acididurans]|uniref:ABC transporter permease n=1 Tax=Candidatus Gallionella acididurans TaxID=1796491 RepID=A0A139BTQ0_9PROT|nr:MAG: ABC transporter permease [Candidatus Gallionella acididurans]